MEMFWTTDRLKLGITIIVVILLFVLPLSSILLSSFISELTIRARPEQHDQVEVIGRRTATRYTGGGRSKPMKIPQCIIAFKLSDSTEKEFTVPYEIYNSIQENEAGTLTYQEKNNSTKWQQRRFISFEKDA